MTTQKKSKSVIIALSTLLFLAILVGGYFWNQSNLLRIENESLGDELYVFSELRWVLLEDVENLQTEVNELLAANDTLEILFEEKIVSINEKDEVIRTLKREFPKDVDSIKAEIEQLKAIKSELTQLVAKLRAENEQLMDSNEALAVQVANMEIKNNELTFEVTELKLLNSSFEDEKKKFLATSTRATNFRIDLYKNNNKPTASFRRTKDVIVSFDIKHLPEHKKGNNNLHLVIKDANGFPIKVENPIFTTIVPDTGEDAVEIVAQQSINVDLSENDRLQFEINPNQGTLHKGYYRVAVYANWGLLGGAEFHLR